MNILSLCDGMSCGRIALKELGIKIDNYYASEIKDIAIKVTQYNYPDTIQIGNVNKISYKDGILFTEKGDFKVGKIDLMMWGSPCQTFSKAMKKELRIGLEDRKKSGLFLECYRVFKEVNPSFFLMENVAGMKEDDKNLISKLLEIDPIRINSKIVAPALRDRLYWTNIPCYERIKEKENNLQDNLDFGYTDRIKARGLLVSDSRPLASSNKMVYRYFYGFNTLIFKDEEQYKKCKKYYDNIKTELGRRPLAKDFDNINEEIFNGVRYLNQKELERCQTVPAGYTKCLTRNEAANVLGDGWTIEIIKFLLKNLRKEYNKNE